MYVVLLSSPDRHLLRTSINTPHLSNLVILFKVILLIDANGINPHNSLSLFESQIPQNRCQVRGHQKRCSIAPDPSCDIRITPNVRQCFIWWMIVQRRVEEVAVDIVFEPGVWQKLEETELASLVFQRLMLEAGGL